jgi:metal-responsive CopG/Arc/MetJ family transcriptional regulator
MKEKTSITLSKDLLSAIDRAAGSKYSRSAFIERILRRYLRKRAIAAANARDIELINRHAESLNRKALEVLEYQSLDE